MNHPLGIILAECCESVFTGLQRHGMMVPYHSRCTFQRHRKYMSFYLCLNPVSWISSSSDTYPLSANSAMLAQCRHLKRMDFLYFFANSILQNSNCLSVGILSRSRPEIAPALNSASCLVYQPLVVLVCSSV